MMLIWMSVAFVALLLFVSLGVDLGRAQLAKTQLQQACDAAARYGAGGLAGGVSVVQSRVTTAASDNRIDGTPLSINTASDLEFGLWDSTTRTFTVLTGSDRYGATAIRVTGRRTAARNSAITTPFAAILGRRNIDLTAVAIATYGRPRNIATPGDASPWLAGMPSGSTIAATGGNPTSARAPDNSPAQVTGINLSAGNELVFRQASGTTSYINAGNYGPDGQTDWIVNQAAVNGINTTYAPIQALMGIFLDDRAPNTYSQAAALDFSTSTSRNFSSLSPQLKQVFFIGDGLDNNGNLQRFVVPNGATRLYLGIMDEKGWWWDNTGELTVTAMDDRVTLVK
jgi:hypothetical protein